MIYSDVPFYEVHSMNRAMSVNLIAVVIASILGPGFYYYMGGDLDASIFGVLVGAIVGTSLMNWLNCGKFKPYVSARKFDEIKAAKPRR